MKYPIPFLLLKICIWYTIMKKYKAFQPETTIANIRTILHDLDLLLHESHISHRNFYSCRVILGNKGLLPLNIGTNGKGRSFEYSLASGYAEFMERLQNQLLLNSKKMLTSKTFNVYSVASSDGNVMSKTIYSSDEQYIATSVLDSMVCNELARMSGFLVQGSLQMNSRSLNKRIIVCACLSMMYKVIQNVCFQ